MSGVGIEPTTSQIGEGERRKMKENKMRCVRIESTTSQIGEKIRRKTKGK